MGIASMPRNFFTCRNDNLVVCARCQASGFLLRRTLVAPDQARSTAVPAISDRRAMTPRGSSHFEQTCTCESAGTSKQCHSQSAALYAVAFVSLDIHDVEQRRILLCAASCREFDDLAFRQLRDPCGLQQKCESFHATLRSLVVERPGALQWLVGNLAIYTQSTQASATPSGSACASANTAASRRRDGSSSPTHRCASSSVARSSRRRRHSPRAASAAHTPRRRRRSSSFLPLFLLSFPLCLFTPSLLFDRSALCLSLSSDLLVLELLQILRRALPLRV